MLALAGGLAHLGRMQVQRGIDRIDQGALAHPLGRPAAWCGPSAAPSPPPPDALHGRGDDRPVPDPVIGVLVVGQQFQLLVGEVVQLVEDDDHRNPVGFRGDQEAVDEAVGGPGARQG